MGDNKQYVLRKPIAIEPGNIWIEGNAETVRIYEENFDEWFVEFDPAGQRQAIKTIIWDCRQDGTYEMVAGEELESIIDSATDAILALFSSDTKEDDQ